MNEISKYITIIRPEFMTFCKDACRSAALNHILFRIAGKAKDQPREKIQAGEVLFYAKTELLTSEMSDAWGVCKVRKEVNELIGMGLIGRTKDPEWGANRTKHFFFGSEQCDVFIHLCEENHICFIHLDLPDEVKHLIYLSLAKDKSIKCSCSESEARDISITCKSYNHQMETMDVSNGNDKSIEAITKTTTKTSNKDNYEEEDTEGCATATPTPAQSSSDEPSLSQEIQEAKEQVNAALEEIESYSHSNAQATEEKADSAGYEKAEQKAFVAASGRQTAHTEKPANKKPEPAQFTEGGQKVHDAWGSLFKSPPVAGEKTILCANALYERIIPWCLELHLSCKDLLKEIKNWLYVNDPDYYRKRGVKLCDIGREFEGWQSAKTEALEREKAKTEPIETGRPRTTVSGRRAL